MTLNGGSYSVEQLRALLEKFKEQYDIITNLRVLGWGEAWGELVKIALYHRGAELSQVGSTWMGGLAAMNVLRPFSPAELSVVGGAQAFIPGTWRSCVTHDGGQVLGLPWIAESFFPVYWRDMLEQAGVDESAAFASPESMEESFARLNACGIPAWVFPPGEGLLALHNSMSMIWGAGGELASPDGRRVMFNEPAARAGLRAFYRLFRHLPDQFHGLLPGQQEGEFLARRAAVTYASMSLMNSLHGLPNADELLPRLGACLSPGVPFVAGSNIAVWQDAPFASQQAAVLLAQFLCSKDSQLAYFHSAGSMPARLDALHEVPLGEPLMQVTAAALRTGRGFSQIPMWGLIEDRLIATLARIGQEYAVKTDADLDALFDRYLLPLEKRLMMSLAR